MERLYLKDDYIQWNYKTAWRLNGLILDDDFVLKSLTHTIHQGKAMKLQNLVEFLYIQTAITVKWSEYAKHLKENKTRCKMVISIPVSTQWRECIWRPTISNKITMLCGEDMHRFLHNNFEPNKILNWPIPNSKLRPNIFRQNWAG